MRQSLFWEALILSALLLYLSRTYTIALYIFLPLYFFLVYYILRSDERTLEKLTALSILTAISLSLRFDYLIWGDPWADYAINKGILESKMFPLTDEEPLARFLTVFSSMLTDINPMTVQKFLIPALGSLAVPALYVFMKDFMPERGARYSGLLLMVATPYMHWVTQGVRESLGLFMSVLALYLCYEAVKNLNLRKLAVALFSIMLVTMTHPRAALVFIVAWIGFSLFILDSSRQRTGFSLGIAVFSIIFSLRWWEVTSSRGLGAINGFLSAKGYTLGEGYFITFTIVVFIYMVFTFIGTKIPEKIEKRRKLLYTLGLAIIVVSSIYVISSLSKSFFLPYPQVYYFNGIVLSILALFSFYYFLEKDRIPVLGWLISVCSLLTLNLLLKYSGSDFSSFPLMDPMRIFEFASIPLASLAGLGIFMLEKRLNNMNIKLLFSLFILVTLITSLPSIAFLGYTFSSGNLLYDERSWLISHNDQEISGIKWMEEYSLDMPIITDQYITYALKPTGKVADVNRELTNNRYKLITKRMLYITDFGELILAKRMPITETKIKEIETDNIKIYSNRYTEIYFG